MSGLIILNWKYRLLQAGARVSRSKHLSSSSHLSSIVRCDQCKNKSLLRLSTLPSTGSSSVDVRSVRTITRSSALSIIPPATSWRGRRALDREYQQLLEDSQDSVEDTVKNASKENIISIPLHLHKRLDRFMEKKQTKAAIQKEIIDNSRIGRKVQVLIHCKDRERNHYRGQTYERGKDVLLASSGWRHRKSAGDFFTLFPGSKKRESPFFMQDTKEMTFADLGIEEGICRNLKNSGISQPTHIQVFGIPQILKGKKTLIAAETGCGKTLVYLLPLIQQVLEEKKCRVRPTIGQPSAIILVPSRELADQIYEVAIQMTYHLDIKVKLLQGGSLGYKMRNAPRNSVDILVATTNALNILSTAGTYGIGRVSHIVLDEADTLLDDSFFPELVGPFLNRFPWTDLQRDLQLTLVSATLPKDMSETLGTVMKIDDFDDCTTPGLHNLPMHVPQTFLRLKKSKKHDKLLEILKEDIPNKNPVIIFCNKAVTCNWLSTFLNDEGYDCTSIHGRMPLKYRVGRMEAYKNGELDIIIATDLASRGIDTVRTKHVINFEFPLYVADYIHRCGRTGRVGSEGTCRVTNFISRKGEVDTVNKIEKSVRKSTLLTVNANIKRLYADHYGSFKEIKPITDPDDESEDDGGRSERDIGREAQ